MVDTVVIVGGSKSAGNATKHKKHTAKKNDTSSGSNASAVKHDHISAIVKPKSVANRTEYKQVEQKRTRFKDGG